MNIALVICLILVAVKCVLGSSGAGILNQISMMSVGKHSSGRRTKETTMYINEFEEIPSIKEAIDHVLRARQIAVIRLRNCTVVAYNTPHTEKYALQHAIGCSPLHMVFQPRYHLLVTGIVGDCRLVAKYVKQIVLNATVEYMTLPTAERVAFKLGNYLKAFSSRRQLACHAFIIDSGCRSSSDSTENKIAAKVYEVNTAGSYCEVLCGTAGSNMMSGGKILQREYRGDLTLDESKELLSEVFNASAHTDIDEQYSTELHKGRGLLLYDASYRSFIFPDFPSH